ncbi:hypothetical protein FIV42_26090 [Persicimonas caeni]|uniref:Lipoprotein n=1 Tax=Persicimonas caeni TaxID=2292766 RepID=A0A4Y6Q273_PERCE|nr:hypothetical protein [Persicimonas caeni]QDG54085.1 hypothetical protein FIV42_26090 [Persicimonas caeni]QED35306.1 hypothetical protein FRD00_26085 [Persicimonas caeni]
MQKTMVLALAALSFCVSSACVSPSQAVKDRATFDFDCPKDQIEVIELGTLTYGAKGCNKRATYIYDNGKAIMNSDAENERAE